MDSEAGAVIFTRHLLFCSFYIFYNGTFIGGANMLSVMILALGGALLVLKLAQWFIKLTRN